MYRHVCIDMRVGMRVDMFVDMRVDMCVYMYADMCIDVCIDMCTDMCINICIDMCMPLPTSSRDSPSARRTSAVPSAFFLKISRSMPTAKGRGALMPLCLRVA